MTIQIRTGSLTFGKFQGSGPRVDFRDLTFSSPVSTAAAFLTGISASYSPGDGDHHLGNLDVRLGTSLNGSTVRVTVTFGLRDWSGNWDDEYEGQVFFTVVGE
jgi:hypothetical protein